MRILRIGLNQANVMVFRGGYGVDNVKHSIPFDNLLCLVIPAHAGWRSSVRKNECLAILRGFNQQESVDGIANSM